MSLVVQYAETPIDEEDLSQVEISVEQMSRTIRKEAALLTTDEARFLVDTYYAIQGSRIVANNRAKAIERESDRGPSKIFDWLKAQNVYLEQQLKGALNEYAKSKIPGRWALSITGIGPVIAAGLLAHIDPHRAPTAGSLWRLAGMDPTVKWLGKEKATLLVNRLMDENNLAINDPRLQAECANAVNVRADRFVRSFTTFCTTTKTGKATKVSAPTKAKLIAYLARRPWDDGLKRLLFIAGDSFVKQSNRESDEYGKYYRQQRAMEEQKNINGEFAGDAARILTEKNFGKETEAYRWYSGIAWAENWANERRLPVPRDPNLTEEEQAARDDKLPRRVKMPDGTIVLWDEAVAKAPRVGQLPPGHLHMRGIRYCSKLFLSHYHRVARQAAGLEVVKPYAIGILDHKAYIPPPHLDLVEDWMAAEEGDENAAV